MRFRIRVERWPLREPFVIARETIGSLPLVTLTIEADGATGWAEAAGVDYVGETPEQMVAEIEAYLARFGAPPGRDRLLLELAPGGTRNAIDCALWDWEAKRSGRSAAAMAGLSLRPLLTAYTIGLDCPQAMAAKVTRAPAKTLLKLKLGARDGRDLARVAAVRDVAPAARLLVDVNEGWSFDYLVKVAPDLRRLGVELIEQPLAVEADRALATYRSPVPLCADESMADIDDLDRIAGYDFINLKLDKCGGLTAALALVAEAKRRSLGLMVGSMLGTSLGMAPAFLVGQSCDYVDLDGPLLLAGDRSPAMCYDGAMLQSAEPTLWG